MNVELNAELLWLFSYKLHRRHDLAHGLKGQVPIRVESNNTSPGERKKTIRIIGANRTRYASGKQTKRIVECWVEC